MELVFLIAVGFGLMWVFIVLPQRRRMAAHARMVDELKVGDEVLTAGGLFGDVTEIGEDEVALEVAPGVEVRVAARAIASVVPPDAYDDDGEDAADAPHVDEATTASATDDASAAPAVDDDRR